MTDKLSADDHIGLLHRKHNKPIHLAEKSDRDFNSKAYLKDDIDLTRATMGSDWYVGANPVKSIRSRRLNSSVPLLANIFLDLDTYNVDGLELATTGEIQSALKELAPGLSTPTIIGSTGRGYQAVWTVEAPEIATPLTLQQYESIHVALITTFDPLGSDPSVKDPARVIRVSGTVNQKSGTRAAMRESGDMVSFDSMLVWADQTVKTPDQYGRELANRYVEQEIKPKVTKRLAESEKHAGHAHGKRMTRTTRFSGIANDALPALVQLRGGKLNDGRKRALYAFTVAACGAYQSPDQIYAACQDFINQSFTDPHKYSPTANSNVVRQRFSGNGKKLLWTNQQFIKLLEITQDEQRQGLPILIDRGEKYNRDLDRKEKKRRADGVPTRSEYDLKRNRAKQSNQAQVQQMLYDGKNKVEIAKETGLSIQYVRKLAKLSDS